MSKQDDGMRRIGPAGGTAVLYWHKSHGEVLLVPTWQYVLFAFKRQRPCDPVWDTIRDLALAGF